MPQDAERRQSLLLSPRIRRRRYDFAGALILARVHPTVVPEPVVGPVALRPEALGALDDVDPGSPQDYTLDSMPPTGGAPDGA